MTPVAIFTALIFLHALVSGRMERTVVTAPIAFSVAGVAVALLLPETPDRYRGNELFLHAAEIGLVLLLFADSSRIDLRVLKRIRNLPVRLLGAGMLLTIALGVLAALAILPELSIWEAGILAAILAPTDAGLGQIIVNSPRVPMKIRQALNVEAGLNDGLAVPFLLFFIAMVGNGADREQAGLMRFIVEQLGFGVGIGVGIGVLGGLLLHAAHTRGWMAHSWQQLGVVALPLLCLLASEAAGASMFIAAFVAGLAVQTGFQEAGRHSGEFTEEWGQLLNLSVFFLFGLMSTGVWSQFGWRHAVYALLSLTVVRMLPVAIALVGTRLSGASVVFMGWFGPRGLASIVLGLVYLEQHTHTAGEASIRLAVMMTVGCSILAHGISAMPGMEIYARKVGALGEGAPELEEAAGGAR